MSRWSIRDRLEDLGAIVTCDQLDGLDLTHTPAAHTQSFQFPEELFRAELFGQIIAIERHSKGGCRLFVIPEDRRSTPSLVHKIVDRPDLDTAISLAVTKVWHEAGTGQVFPWSGPTNGACERCGWVVLGTNERLTAAEQQVADATINSGYYLWVCPQCLATADSWRHILLA